MENTMDTNNKFMVTGLFRDKESAECAYSALGERGYEKEDADVVMSDETRDRYYSDDAADDTELGSKALEGSGTGAAIGGTIGAVIGAIAAIGTSVVLPGLGLIVAGPLAAALAGAGAGGLAGGLVGALIGAGIPEEHAEAYEAGIKSGSIMLRANPRTAEDAAFIENKWRECGGERIYSNAGQQQRTNAAATGGNVTIPVIEEELEVGKRTVETGGVHVETKITERPVEETVRLREENVVVDRQPVNRAATEADLDSVQEGDFVVKEKAEKAVVGKDARVVEEVVVGKKVDERTETIGDTVRRTDVEIEDLSEEQLRNKPRR